MLTRLEFKNFKAWRDSGPIRLAPLTVLFGTNSAGKTSIPQLLLLLKQTAESSDRKRALHLGASRTDARSSVDLGTYDDIAHDRQTDVPIDVAFAWTLSEPLIVDDPLTDTDYRGDAVEFRASFRCDRRHQPIVESFEYRLVDGETQVLRVGMRVVVASETQRPIPGSEVKRPGGTGSSAVESPRPRGPSGPRHYELTASPYKATRHKGRAWPLPEPLRFYGFPDEAIAYYQNTGFVTLLVLELERLLRGVYHLGPLREDPRRLYLWSGEMPEHVGVRGERAVEAILAEKHRAFNFGPKQKKQPLERIVAERLQSIGLITDFEVKSLGTHRNEYEVLVRTNPTLPEVKLTDVGFGVSQVLPVIVECFYVPRRSIVIFEQPEIHLHPSAQAELADLFVDAIKAREDGIDRECQFIIESHSEHFLRRLQRRIAEEKLAPSDTALYVVSMAEGTAKIDPLDVDEFGNIRNWPDGFFGDEMGDIVGRTEAQARRMQARSRTG